MLAVTFDDTSPFHPEYLLKPRAKTVGLRESLVTTLAVHVIGILLATSMRRVRRRLACEHIRR